MNTPAHIVLSAVVLGRKTGHKHWLAATLGALAPDLPMFGFYLIQRVGLGRSEQLIWSRLYYEPAWQVFFDFFNGLPLIAVGAAIAYGRRWQGALVFFLSMAIHASADLLVHREDAHGHFFPLSDWRFISPVSYWDPAHHGIVFSLFETVGVLACAYLLFRRGGRWRSIGLICGTVHAILFVVAITFWGNTT